MRSSSRGHENGEVSRAGGAIKAILQNAYGPPSVLVLGEVDKPPIGVDDVIVRVRAAAVHAGDYYAMTGVPYLVRLTVGWPRPRNYIPGFDVAGRVEEVGKNVTSLRPGDEVFGAVNGGACAEYAVAEKGLLVRKPAVLSFEQAAAVPTSALAALHGLRDAGKVKAGQKVLVNGASGGVGHFAVQIAKSLGAQVTGVCSTHNAQMVRSLGAHHVIDYTMQDFTRTGERYDLILDNVGNHSFAEIRRALAPDGKHIPNTGNAGLWYVVKAGVRSLFIRQQGRPYLSTPNPDDMVALKGLIEAGDLRPVIDRTYPLEQVPEAMEYLGKGRASGKVVIVM